MGRFLLMVAMLALVGCESEPMPDEFGITRYTSPRTLEHSALTTQDGTSLSVRDLAGDYVLLSMGYTHCPDI
jgi:protein SCO1/2